MVSRDYVYNSLFYSNLCFNRERRETVQGALDFKNPKFDFYSSENFESFVCLATNLMAQNLILSGFTNFGFFFSLLSLSFLILKLGVFTIKYYSNLNDSSLYSIKAINKTIQTSFYFNQNLLFVWVNICYRFAFSNLF